MSDGDDEQVIQIKNLRTETKVELKSANKAWMACVEQNFMKQWMAGGDVKITDVCVDEHSRMMELDAEVYEGMPYKNVPSMSDLMKNSVDPNVV